MKAVKKRETTTSYIFWNTEVFEEHWQRNYITHVHSLVNILNVAPTIKTLVTLQNSVRYQSQITVTGIKPPPGKVFCKVSWWYLLATDPCYLSTTLVLPHNILCNSEKLVQNHLEGSGGNINPNFSEDSHQRCAFYQLFFCFSVFWSLRNYWGTADWQREHKCERIGNCILRWNHPPHTNLPWGLFSQCA